MFKKEKNEKCTVKSMAELKSAVRREESYIEVTGDLARKMKWLGKLSPVKIAALAALLATSSVAAPVTASGIAALGIAGSVGMGTGEILTIIFAIEVPVMVAILKKYDVGVEVYKEGKLRVILSAK